MAKILAKNKSCIGLDDGAFLTFETRLNRSLKTIAGLITSGNEDLWPLFEYLDNELQDVKRREALLIEYETNSS